LRCCWKGNVSLSTCVKVSKKKGRWSTINLTTMTEATRAQVPKYVVEVMMDVDMSLTPSKVTGREACLWAKVFLGY
jgi:hypothetical protein